ncbi:MAG: aldehyde dehydrogenase family protein [Alphaproteobacteria bacterium]|nr:aldehyde dehydrogenase family protein [Alphaproteobacteria bacterium]
MNTYQLLINGVLVNTKKSMDVINPANEEPFATVALADEEELDRAVSAAIKAFETYKTSSIKERQGILVKIADAILENKTKIATALTMEQGKTLQSAVMEVEFAASFCQHFSEVDIPSEVLIDDAEQLVEIHHVPLGVVAGIIPWNFPFLICIYKLAPILLAGNSLIIKPAPSTPITAAILGEIIKDIVPAGLVNILIDNGELGPKITTHKGITKISFTGSIETGKKILESVAPTLKRPTLELGGNDAAIVLNDVDPKIVAKKILGSAFLNSGQTCIALKRLYVQEKIYDELCEELATLANSATIGDGMDEKSQFGPVQNKEQYEKIKNYIENGRQNGSIIAGGVIPKGPGYFIPLTLVKDIKNGTALVDEEPFGPVLPIIKFTTIDEAIVYANDSSYGLGGSVWSNDLDKAYAIAEKMDAGTIWINQHTAFGPNIPSCPMKQSGLGVEWGKEGLLEYTSLKVINRAKL